MRIYKHGSEFFVRLPAELVAALGLQVGDEVEIKATQRPAADRVKGPGIDERLEVIRGFREKLPEGFKFCRDEANRR
ncbi:AbrB/MazE/SpoVT family DNA-binding domain-containing protein [Maricaulis salignorans]|uniref:AbrB/MazE/SpoVT family DNA-binding domain-containing protein n=1 Tax=Maricaulis salignorans TaxID=144026 RepID=UPI003A93BAC2